MTIKQDIESYFLPYKDLMKTNGISFEGSDFHSMIDENAFWFSQITPFLKKDGIRVLEIGSGSGILLSFLAKSFPNITFEGIEPFLSGHDHWKEMSKKIDNVEIYNTDIESFIPEEKYDLIFSINVLEHVPKWKEYIHKSHELLLPRGKNIVLCPDHHLPYESHYIIPIIINKRITKLIFQKIIERYEKKNMAIGHFDALNLIKKKQLSKYLITNNINYTFNDNIKYEILNRLLDNKYLLVRQKIIGRIALFLLKSNIHKFLLDVLKIPFPYLMLIMEKD